MFKSKRVLITAGPTWVPIDDVRVISNSASGETGILLAKEARKRAFGVTLLMGPGTVYPKMPHVVLKPFRYFDELRASLKQTLTKNVFDLIIFAAAVSDYKPARVTCGKMNSGKSSVSLKLVATPKLITEVKKLQPGATLVGFKYELGLKKEALIHEARTLMRKSSADMVVANTRKKDGSYCAYIVEACGAVSGEINSKTALAKILFTKYEHMIG